MFRREERTYTEAEVEAYIEQHMGGDTFTDPDDPSIWQQIGTFMLHPGRRFRTEDEHGEAQMGNVVDVDDDSALVHFDGDEEPTRILSRRLTQAKEIAIERRVEGAVVAGVLSITGLFIAVKKLRK